MNQITKNKSEKEPPVECWQFFCDIADENEALKHANKDQAVTNILSNSETEFLITRVDKMVTSWLKQSISLTQLRNLYNVCKKSPWNLNKIRIQLIYISARQNNFFACSFIELIQSLLQQESEINRSRIINFIESVLSYHKYYSNK